MTPTPLRRMILHRTRGPTLGTHNVVTNELQRQSQRLVPHVQLNIRDHPVLIQTNQLMVMPRQRVRRNASEKPHFRYFQISVNSTRSHKNPRRTLVQSLMPLAYAAHDVEILTVPCHMTLYAKIGTRAHVCQMIIRWPQVSMFSCSVCLVLRRRVEKIAAN